MPSGDLAAVNRTLHDRWFDVSEVRHDQRRALVSIPFRRRRQPKAAAGTEDTWLHIGRVDSLRLEDTQRIDRYDFNELQFMPDVGILRVATGIPMVFEMKVSGIDVAVSRDVDV